MGKAVNQLQLITFFGPSQPLCGNTLELVLTHTSWRSFDIGRACVDCTIGSCYTACASPHSISQVAKPGDSVFRVPKYKKG